ncbi:hypothetical protein JVU11DRAFT_3350 [Chiua virens]|nr:hypothetical protein JVU11DRAFT_3350 [Chiua virens]
MPWELSSILSRLRHPARHLPPPDQPSQDPVPRLEQENFEKQLPIDRRILQDPSSFLDETQDDLPRSLTPSTRLPSGNTRYRPKPTESTLEPLSEGSDISPVPSVDISPPTQSRLTISRISRIASSGEWSTFGRKREHRVPDVAGIAGCTSPLDDLQNTSRSESPSPAGHSKHPSADSTRSTFTLSRLTHPTSRPSSGTHQRLSSPSIRSTRQSPDIRINSRRSSSPTNTMSSQRHPRTPPSQSSYIAAISTHVTPAVTNLTTPIQHELDLDSPHTFGRPTPPPDNSADFSFAHSSPPPPLPPLDHPELAAVLSSRRKSMSTDQPTLSAFRDRSNTLPTNRRTPRKDELFGSLSFKLGHSVRHRSSLPHAKRDSISRTTERQETRSPDGHDRARTVSAHGRQRRTSADWSSYQATVGVNSHANQAWPAEVSREILRLSLGPTSGPDLISGSSVKRNTQTQGESADPTRRPNRGAMSRSFLPFPHPSRPDSPPNLAASVTLIDGREPVPPRRRSLQFNLGNNRGSQQLAKFTMAKVKRSLSVVESRNAPNNGTSGVTSASSALSKTDPARLLAEAPQASYSLLPSLALTPSRSLLFGHVPPSNLNTPTSSSMQAEPSTPTPEPRHLSDKSRGKRKAEDNIDLTPPEQKKEGQRPTFLLPTEPRSQRISNSSHAPSSYHRKRARLSTTSPFATPVQSRPASVLETPQSARNQRFASLSSSTGARIAPSGTPSRVASTHSRQPPTPSTSRKHERRQSMSQVSIPLSAFVSPHAPSISRSSKFHMRDPRKPSKKPNDTPWGLRFATEDEPGSPIQAWCFFIGFLLFPVWWIAALFLRVPTTRIAGDVDAEKGVAIDDPQIEHDAKSWRFRCRVMAVVSFFTYIPFIVLVAIFAPR